MSAMTYAEKLKSPLWQRKRLEVLERDNFTCKLCGDTETTLHVHHKEYIKGNDVWDYENTMLETLCEVCHKAITDIQKEYGKGYSFLSAHKDDVFLYIVVQHNEAESKLIFTYLFDGEWYGNRNILFEREIYTLTALLNFAKNQNG